jgi:hypothetical protein
MTNNRIAREAAWLGGLVLVGLVMLPVLIYVVGHVVFGEYGGGSLGDFYTGLLGEFLEGQPAVWFLLLSAAPGNRGRRPVERRRAVREPVSRNVTIVTVSR